MPNSNNKAQVLVGNQSDYTARFLIGDSDSSVITCVGNSFLALIIDVSFTPGDLTFLSSLDNVYFCQLAASDYSGVYKITEAQISALIAAADDNAQGIQLPLDPSVFVGVQYLQIICSNAQAAAQNVRLVMGPVLS